MFTAQVYHQGKQSAHGSVRRPAARAGHASLLLMIHICRMRNLLEMYGSARKSKLDTKLRKGPKILMSGNCARVNSRILWNKGVTLWATRWARKTRPSRANRRTLRRRKSTRRRKTNNRLQHTSPKAPGEDTALGSISRSAISGFSYS
jgi:hypothetical protein